VRPGPARVGSNELSSQVQIEGAHESQGQGQGSESGERGTNSTHTQAYKHKPPTFLMEFGVVLSRPLFLCLVCGYAAQTAMLIGLSTFGSAFMMGLG
jgi:hypothetical protein